MTTIDESRTAKGYTPAASVPAAFGQARTLEGIVIHHWGERGQTHDGVVDFFCSTGPGETSAHFVVSAGRINCIVSPLDAAWHCPGKNATTIGIECRPEATAGDYLTVAELVRWLRNEYGDLPLSMHRDWYNTACPGVWDLNRINTLANAAATIQSTKPKEDTLSAAEVNQIKAAIKADGDKTREYIKKLAYSGWQDDKGEKHPGFMLVIEENQKRIDKANTALGGK